MHDAARLPALVAEHEGRPVGLATLADDGGGCELVTLDAFVSGLGVGSALLQAVCAEAATRGRPRVWLVTSNDNVAALRFYQRRGFRLVAVHAGAIAEARRTLKPSIPEVGLDGIPIRDELELERWLVSWAATLSSWSP